MQNGVLISTQTGRKSHSLFVMHVQTQSKRKKYGSKRTTRTRDTNTASKNIGFSRVLISRPLICIISCFTTRFTASSAHRHHRLYTVNLFASCPLDNIVILLRVLGHCVKPSHRQNHFFSTQFHDMTFISLQALSYFGIQITRRNAFR